MDVSIRTAEASDLDQLVGLDPQAVVPDDDRTMSIGRAVEHSHCLVAAHGAEVVGYVVLTPGHFFGRDFVELLVVLRAHRRCGVGRRLLQSAVAAATTPRIFSSTNESNIAMRSLFASAGWEFSGQLDGLDPGDPELVYFVDRS